MTLSTTPESVVQRQLDAYNARDIDALMGTYTDDAQQFEYPATLLVSGAVQVRERTTARFQESNLHARLIRRIVMGQVVIDHEEVTRTFPEGTGKIELVAKTFGIQIKTLPSLEPSCQALEGLVGCTHEQGKEPQRAKS